MFKLYKNETVYQVFIRNYTKEGSISAFIKKLDYIQSLGVSYIQLLPVHPIGKIGRKGSYGSPYSIQDYLAISADLGNFDDFALLIKEAHQRNLKIIMDMVFNHTSKDSLLLKEHPDYYLHNQKGDFFCKCADWSDVYDLDHNNPALEEYLCNVLLKYVNLGVDGFRFDLMALIDIDTIDVASLIKPSFFKMSKERIMKINPDILYIAEAVDAGFINYMRSQGFAAYSNQELAASGIDVLYHYSSWHWLKKFLADKTNSNLEEYKAAFTVETSSINNNALIMRAIENHDYPRLASYSKNDSFTRNLLAFSFFTKGLAFIYGGEECKDTKTCPLFEKEPINLTIHDQDYFSFVKELISLKKKELSVDLMISNMEDSSPYSMVVTNYFSNKEPIIGIFNLKEENNLISSSRLTDGNYLDLLTHKEYLIKNHSVLVDRPLFLEKKN